MYPRHFLVCLLTQANKRLASDSIHSRKAGEREKKKKNHPKKNQNIVLRGDVANRFRSYPLYETARSPKRGNRKARISQIVSFVTKSMLIFINLQTSYAFSVFVSIQLYLSKTGWTYLRRNLTETEQTTQVGPVCHVTIWAGDAAQGESKLCLCLLMLFERVALAGWIRTPDWTLV